FYRDCICNIIRDDNSIIQSKNVVITATSHFKRIQFNDTIVDLNYRYLTYTHYHIVVSGDVQKKISYVRILNHPQIHRISDISNQLKTARLNETVLLVGVFDDKIAEWGSEKEAADKIMD